MVEIKEYIEELDEEIVFYGSPTKECDDYDDEFGTVKGYDYYICENIKWDRNKYSEEENRIIEEWFSTRYVHIEQLLIAKYKEEINDTRDN